MENEHHDITTRAHCDSSTQSSSTKACKEYVVIIHQKKRQYTRYHINLQIRRNPNTNQPARQSARLYNKSNSNKSIDAHSLYSSSSRIILLLILSTTLLKNLAACPLGKLISSVK